MPSPILRPRLRSWPETRNNSSAMMRFKQAPTKAHRGCLQTTSSSRSNPSTIPVRAQQGLTRRGYFDCSSGFLWVLGRLTTVVPAHTKGPLSTPPTVEFSPRAQAFVPKALTTQTEVSGCGVYRLRVAAGFGSCETCISKLMAATKNGKFGSCRSACHD